MAIALGTLQTWLDEALTAKQKLVTGTAAVEVSSQEGRVRFTEANMDKLDAWIGQLNTWIANGGVSTGTSQRMVFFTF